MRRATLIASVLLLLAGGGITAFVLNGKHAGHDIRGSSSVEFVTTETVTRPRLRPSIVWPMFGYDAARQHVANGVRLRPPFRRVWVAGGRSMLEFPPAIAYGRLYIGNQSGVVLAFDARTGERAWAFAANRGIAASPAVGSYAHGTVYEAFLNRFSSRAKQPDDGEAIALSVGTGQVRWRRRVGASETSPLLADGLVYVGGWDGTVYALDERTGSVRWTFQTGGEIKGGMASSGRRVYAGSYDGHVYALDAATGRLVWRASADPRLVGHGTFYSTPAVAYGRVFIGSTDGKVYSFGAASGRLRWSHSTGGYVYGSPAIWRERVLVGSYDHHFYALDAATGALLWRFLANGPISGSATVVDGVVYFATLRGKTYGLDARNGRMLWSFPDGKYAAVVADSRRLYLVGYGTIYGLEPR